jgi:hypothetical protein
MRHDKKESNNLVDLEQECALLDVYEAIQHRCCEGETDKERLLEYLEGMADP